MRGVSGVGRLFLYTRQPLHPMHAFSAHSNRSMCSVDGRGAAHSIQSMTWLECMEWMACAEWMESIHPIQ